MINRIRCLAHELKEKHPEARILEIHLNEHAYRVVEESAMSQLRYLDTGVATPHLRIGDISIKYIKK